MGAKAVAIFFEMEPRSPAPDVEGKKRDPDFELEEAVRSALMKDRDPRDMQEQIVYTDAGAQTVPIALSIWAAVLAAHNRENTEEERVKSSAVRIPHTSWKRSMVDLRQSKKSSPAAPSAKEGSGFLWQMLLS